MYTNHSRFWTNKAEIQRFLPVISSFPSSHHGGLISTSGIFYTHIYVAKHIDWCVLYGIISRWPSQFFPVSCYFLALPFSTVLASYSAPRAREGPGAYLGPLVHNVRLSWLEHGRRGNVGTKIMNMSGPQSLIPEPFINSEGASKNHNENIFPVDRYPVLLPTMKDIEGENVAERAI